MKIGRWIFFLSLLFFAALAPSTAEDLTTDTFIQSAIDKDNWAPGGKFGSDFYNRGSVIENNGGVNLDIQHTQTLGNFRLQNATISGGLEFVIDITSHHPASGHSPFTNTSTSSNSDRQNSTDGTQSSYEMNWTGLFTHPANGYDPPQGGSYPEPDHRGAIDIITYNITGIATGVYPLSQAEIQRRDTTATAARSARYQSSLTNYYQQANSTTEAFRNGFNRASRITPRTGNLLQDAWLGMKHTPAQIFNAALTIGDIPAVRIASEASGINDGVRVGIGIDPTTGQRLSATQRASYAVMSIPTPISKGIKLASVSKKAIQPVSITQRNSVRDKVANVLPQAKTNTCVYSCVVDGQIRYVGITDNIKRRGQEHLREKDIKVQKIRGLDNLSRDDAKAVEQTLIHYHGLGKDGGTLINKINSVSRTKNPTVYEQALTRGAELLKNAGYKGF